MQFQTTQHQNNHLLTFKIISQKLRNQRKKEIIKITIPNPCQRTKVPKDKMLINNVSSSILITLILLFFKSFFDHHIPSFHFHSPKYCFFFLFKHNYSNLPARDVIDMIGALPAVLRFRDKLRHRQQVSLERCERGLRISSKSFAHNDQAFSLPSSVERPMDESLLNFFPSFILIHGINFYLFK